MGAHEKTTVSRSGTVHENVAEGSTSGAGWSRAIVRGVRGNDLAGKAGEIATVLEERLITAEYRFGQLLSIYTLATQFTASRQPVAAAVLYLRSVGYLEVIPQVGCRVVSPSPEEVQDFYALFARTEGLIAHFAAQRCSEEEGRQLVALANELAANPFRSIYDRRAMADGISIFHERISTMARSPLLVERISNLRRIFRFYLCQSRIPGGRPSAAPQHLNALRLQLASAIAEHRHETVEALVQSYVLDALDDWAIVV